MEARLLEEVLERLDKLSEQVEEFLEKENLNGEYPTGEHLIFEYRRKYPYRGKTQCVKDIGLSRTTVNKYWDGLLRDGVPSIEGISDFVKVGRPSKRLTVIAYRQKHPDKTRLECVKDTGLSRDTIRKYWDLPFNENEAKKQKK